MASPASTGRTRLMVQRSSPPPASTRGEDYSQFSMIKHLWKDDSQDWDSALIERMLGREWCWSGSGWRGFQFLIETIHWAGRFLRLLDSLPHRRGVSLGPVNRAPSSSFLLGNIGSRSNGPSCNGG
ncbi:uncharacterized protein M6B38_271605 [Iris pallida]|uniref:Uncharacterized protein n=1 Tax=Iris pallida TaxID=29817 RepID=A0AAX6I7Y4_IRIPA|nr:uncharacterized protein M6B38_271605 [Iris pallida]